ncbi:hypothetical protein N0V90_007122 [Kalmusia sp. IMI 367209]|nr:hypothetical protein N0V90_007122 [Kalmusia sp. IMI 367209]
MPLLKIEEHSKFSLVEHEGSHDIPPYAVLSHTWGADDEEVNFKYLVENTGKSKNWFEKLRFCGKQAATDELQYIWVDTCCIDKSSSAELAEAVNSMFRWYQKAEKCYVYLSEVANDQSFQKSRWFTPGWTLQELLAPHSVEFFSADGVRLGDRHSLMQKISLITGISIAALEGRPLSDFSIGERMGWAQTRETKREEDAAYSLLGIFNVHMPLIYGEGKENASKRLEKQIRESLEDAKGTLGQCVERNSRYQEEKLIKIRQLLSAPDPFTNYQKALKQRQAGTGIWFLESYQFAKWKTEAASMLWLYGIPGCGKTPLSSTIFQSILDHCENAVGAVIAYFFFDFNDAQKQDPELMLRSLIYQLSK